MSDAIAIPIIIIAVALVIVGTMGIHNIKANHPLFVFFMLVLIGGIIAFGITMILSLLSMISSMGS